MLLVLLFWCFMTVPSSLPQPPLPLSLPVHMSVIPPPWKFLPVSQENLVPNFSNSSPFSFSRSLFMVPPQGGWGPSVGLQALYGPYSVSQQISKAVLPQSPTVSTHLLSEYVQREMDEDGQERFRLRTLFHQMGDSSTQRTCVTLHAFRETEEQKASCITQPPPGLCVVTLTLPGSWFVDQHMNRSHQELYKSHNSVRLRNRLQRRKWLSGGHLSSRHHPGFNVDQGDIPKALRNPKDHVRNRIQLYYSYFEASLNLKIISPGCVEDKETQSQRQLFYLKSVALKEEEDEDTGQRSSIKKEVCLNRQHHDEEEEELRLDSHVVIRYLRGPVLIGQPIRMSVNLRSNFSAEFVIIKLRVKKGLVSMIAKRMLLSDLWTVTLERKRGSRHDEMSIVCHKHSPLKQAHNPTLLQQVVCLTVEGLKRSFAVAMTVSAHWWVEYSGRSKPSGPRGAGVSVFSFTDRHFYGIAPIAEHNRIINTAILTNQPVSLNVIVLAVGHDGNVSDVTSAVTCRSTNQNTVKVSPDCSTIFVDGSESGVGSTCALVEFLLGQLRGSVCLEVWAPSVPLRVSLSDPVLNAISGWNQIKENRCESVYQRATVQVLAQFTAQDSRRRTVHLLQSFDWFVDVTQLVRDWLRIDDLTVAAFDAQNNVIGLQPGKTSLYIASEQWDGVLGRCDITVTSDPVSPADLSVQVVSGLGMTIAGNSVHPSVVTATVTAYNVLYNHQQEASVSVWLQFSDDTATPLSSFGDLPYLLRLSSLAESVVGVTPDPDQHVFAQGDGGGPLLRGELLVSTCAEQPITSNVIVERVKDRSDPGEEERRGRGAERETVRLAKGSGWVRVNLDLDSLQPTGKGEEFEFDISDMLIESEVNIFEEENDGNVSKYDVDVTTTTSQRWTKVGERRMVSQTHLETSGLSPNQGESFVHFSPSLENRGQREEDEDKDDEEEEAETELEAVLAAVLSLLCLSTVLFLANCLPCAIRDRKLKRLGMRTSEGDEETERGEEEEDTREAEDNETDSSEVETEKSGGENDLDGREGESHKDDGDDGTLGQ